MKLLTLVLTFWLGRMASASPDFDKSYAFEKMAVVVINTDAEPVYGDQVKSSLTDWLDRQMRFSLVPISDSVLRAAFVDGVAPSLGLPKQEALGLYRPLISQWAAEGLDAVVLAEVQKIEDSFQLFAILILPATGEVVHSAVVPVTVPKQLAGFAEAARGLADELANSIPFDAAIVRREGYRVVLNRGGPKLQNGQHLAVYTLDQGKGGLVFEETGTIELTRVERNLAFGTVLVEKEGRSVARGNKIRISRPADYAHRLPLAGSLLARRPASLFSSETSFQKGELGTLNVDFGASLVTLSLASANVAETNSRTVVFPGASLQGELWLTGRVFVDLGFQLSSATLTATGSGQPESLNSSVSDFRMLFGYRLLLTPRSEGPTVRFSLGYSSHRFTIDPARDPLFFGSANFKGVSLGAGARLPLNDSWGLGADVFALLFPTLDEGPLSSGAAVTQVSAVDFLVKTYYNLTPELDLEAKILFQGYSARFAGTGSRPVSLLSSSRSSRLFAVGLSYYF